MDSDVDIRNGWLAFDVLAFVQLEEDFKNFPVGASQEHIMDEETEVWRRE